MAFASVVELCEGRLAAFTIAPGFSDRSRDDRVVTGYSSFDELQSFASEDASLDRVYTPRGIRGESGVLRSRADSSAESDRTASFEYMGNQSVNPGLKQRNSNRSVKSKLGSLLKKVTSRRN
eukprot:CAMPEP_0182450952 /NCGR_PEP_ID=MMETSP1172-20130603/43451_1 /TAXON_ID=708627 /ORGANISM="Timspurckia oligopyrenoides, Strain CCMP3278" /LENGTH=121 /DNA_ID=CAMNT_0024648679 /DNA_START=990 /DNA_END=1355 /DNA_ORIENTATION=+